MRNVILASSVAFISLAQDGGNTAAGSWTAAFKGQTFVRLAINSRSGSLSGTLSVADMQVDDQGAVQSVGPLPDATPIFDVSQKASTVTFSRKDGDDTDRFELRLLDATRGELRLLPTAEFL